MQIEVSRSCDVQQPETYSSDTESITPASQTLQSFAKGCPAIGMAEQKMQLLRNSPVLKEFKSIWFCNLRKLIRKR